jgi:membrane protein implicated in regulation of membrane protease activity
MPESSSAAPVPNTPSAGAPAVFRERLWPNVWIWIIAAGISAAGILVFAPISIAAGYTAAGVLFAIMAVLLVLSTPTILVTEDTLTVGRATIERRFIGHAETARGKEATAQRGTKLNGLAYLCIRGWIDPVVRIEITDPSDRTPYWLTSSRRPEELAAALSGK